VFIDVVMAMAHCRVRIVLIVIVGFVSVVAVGRSASAQGGGLPGSDLSGSWVAINHEDALERGGGPFLVDYTGLALNDEGRALALSTSLSRFSTLERQCALWSPQYLVFGPFGMKVWGDTDPITGATISWRIGAWEDRAETVIWLDGRAHPSPNAPHTRAGFETGSWSGNTLTTRTTHMKAGIIRRNGAQVGDQATLTTHYIRHGDLMTVLTFIEDPMYLSEPQPISKNFRLDAANTLLSVGPPCVAGYEGTAADVVPHYLPGTNPATDDLVKAYGIPRDAALGGAETMYPEYRKKLKAVYVTPERCLRNCGGPRGGGPQPGAAPPPPGARGGGPSAPPASGRSGGSPAPQDAPRPATQR
jgi:hypothetical protein